MTYFSYLRTFVMVYRCGSYNKASEQLNLTQPAISKHILALEQQLGKPLFYRNGRSIEPTPMANIMANELMPHIDKIEQVFQSSRASTGDIAGIVHIGGLTEFIEEYLTHTIAALIPHDIQFILQNDHNADWTRLLDNQTLDMAIIPIPLKSDSIGYREVYTDDLVMVGREGMHKTSEEVEPWLKLPFIAHQAELPCIKRYLAYLNKDVSMFKRAVSVSSFRVVRQLVLEGAGYSIIPRHFVREELADRKLIEIIAPENPPQMRLYLAWNKYSLRKPRNTFVHDAILDAIKKW